MSGKIFKKSISIFLSLVVVFMGMSGLTSAHSSYGDTSNGGYVTVTIEDSLPIPEGSGYPEPKGVIVDHVKVPFSEGDSMADCIRTACDLENKEIEITGEGLQQYIKTVDGLSEKDKGSQSGWYITFNGTFLNMGSGFYRADLAELEEWQNEQLKTSTKYKKQNMEKYHLKDGDDIHMYYTQKDFGGDLGDNAGPSVIKSITPSQGSLSPEFNSDVKEYTLDIGETDTANVVLNPVALHGFSSMDNINGKYHTRIIKENEVYRPTDTIRVKDGDILKIRCGEYEEVIDTESTGKSVTEYTVKVKANKTGTEPAEDKEENVELRFFDNGLNPGKNEIVIKDENNKVVETTSLEIDPFEAIEADPKVIGYSYRPLNVKLRPGTYTLDCYDKDVLGIKGKVLRYTTKFRVNSGDNAPITLFAMSYESMTRSNDSSYDSDYNLIVKDENGGMIPVTTYTQRYMDHNYGEQVFIYNYFVLQLREGAKYTITEINKDKSATLNLISSQFGGETYFGEINDPEFFYRATKASFKDKGNILNIYLTYEDMKTFYNPSIETVWNTAVYEQEFWYPKDLENFQVVALNEAAYQRFIPANDEKFVKKYKIRDWEVDTESDDKYNIIRFKLNSDMFNMLMIGGGRYYDEKEKKYKESKYVKSIRSSSGGSYHGATKFIHKPHFLKRSELGPDAAEKYEHAWHGIDNGSLLTTIKDEGQYQPLVLNSVVNFFTFRIPQGTPDAMGNTIAEPDKFYKVYGDSVKVSEPKGSMGREWNDITAVKKGTSIVAVGYGDVENGVDWDGHVEYTEEGVPKTVTYDRNPEFAYLPSFNPVYAGIGIFDVDGTGENINPGVYRKTSDGDKPLRKYDRVHFVKSIEFPDGTKKEIKDSYNFVVNPTAKDGKEVKVYYHKPISSLDDFNNDKFYSVPKAGETPGKDWIPADKVEKGSKVKLWEGNNVLLMQSGENTRYFVVAARGLNIKTRNLTRKGKPFAKGDKVQFHFRQLELPVPKLSAIYNPGFPHTTYLKGRVNGVDLQGPETQYSINLYDWIIDPMDFEEYGRDTHMDEKVGYLIKDYRDLKVENVKINSGRFGDGLDGHTNIGPESGRMPNLNADEYKDSDSTLFGVFEDFTLPVIHLEYPEKSNTKEKSQVKDGKLTYTQGESKAAVIEITNIDGKTFKDVKIDGKSVDKKKYEYDKEKSILTLKKDFLDKLTPGVHKVETISEDGNAEGEFTVEKAEPKYADLTELNKAIDNAKAAVKDVKTSKDGKDIAKADKWVTPEAMKALTDKTSEAEKLVNSKPTEDKKAEVENMTAELNKLTQSFKPVAGLKEETKPVPADKTKLNDAITAAEKAKEGVELSADGADKDKEVKWVTDAEMRALDDAIKAAKEVQKEELTKDQQKKVYDAVAALNAAKDKFEAAKKAGTKKPTPEEPKYVDLTELNKAIEKAKVAVKDVKTSKDGKDIAKADKWVTPEAMKALTDKTAEAEKLAKSKPTEDKKAEVAKMTAELNKLTQSFKPVAGLKEETKPDPGKKPDKDDSGKTDNGKQEPGKDDSNKGNIKPGNDGKSGNAGKTTNEPNNKPGSKPTKTNTGNNAKTGDNAMTVGYGMMAVILAGATYFVVRKRKNL